MTDLAERGAFAPEGPGNSWTWTEMQPFLEDASVVDEADSHPQIIEGKTVNVHSLTLPDEGDLRDVWEGSETGAVEAWPGGPTHKYRIMNPASDGGQINFFVGINGSLDYGGPARGVAALGAFATHLDTPMRVLALSGPSNVPGDIRKQVSTGDFTRYSESYAAAAEIINGVPADGYRMTAGQSRGGVVASEVAAHPDYPVQGAVSIANAPTNHGYSSTLEFALRVGPGERLAHSIREARVELSERARNLGLPDWLVERFASERLQTDFDEEELLAGLIPEDPEGLGWVREAIKIRGQQWWLVTGLGRVGLHDALARTAERSSHTQANVYFGRWNVGIDLARYRQMMHGLISMHPNVSFREGPHASHSGRNHTPLDGRLAALTAIEMQQRQAPPIATLAQHPRVVEPLDSETAELV